MPAVTDKACTAASGCPLCGKNLPRKLLITATAFVLLFILCFLAKDQIVAFLLKPVINPTPEGPRVLVTSLYDAFTVKFAASAAMAFVLTAPVVIYQFFRLLSPGLYHKKIIYIVFTAVVCLLFLAAEFRISRGFGITELQWMNIQINLGVKGYIEYIATRMVAFAFIFPAFLFLSKGLLNIAKRRKDVNG